MRAWMTRWLVLGLALLGACGGGTDVTKAHIRLVNASSGYSALDMSIDDSRRFSSVPYGQTADYVDAGPSADKMDSVISLPNSAAALVSLTPAVSKDQYYTVLAYGSAGTLQALVLDNNNSTPSSGKALLRVVNAAPDAGALDVYLTGSSDALIDAVALQPAAALGTIGGYATVNSSTWRLRITGAGIKTDLRLDVSGLTLGSEWVTTLVVTPGRGGVLVNALLLVDRGGIARADNSQARVRVAAAVSAGASVSASVGGTSLATALGSPVVGLYSLLTAGTPDVAVAVNGTAVTTTPPTLAAGGDYTLLVYGTPSAPVVSWIEDDNRLPADSTSAKLRLVHAVADLATPLSLSADQVPIADGVAPGAASAYAGVAATTTAALTATTPGASTPVYTEANRTFIAGAVYTVFVVGMSASTSTPAGGFLYRDR